MIMHKEEVVISSNDVDATLHIRIANLMRIIQDVIMHHVEAIGVGQSETIDKGIIWVVTRLKMEIKRLPKYQEVIVIKTYPGETKAFMYPRHLLIEDKNGNIILRLSSIWMLLDKQTRHLTNSKIITDKISPETYEEELSLPEKVEMVNSLSLKEERRIHYSDIDLNGHLNFAKYIEFIEDLHNNNFYCKTHPNLIILNYLKEIKEDQNVKIYATNGNKEIIKISSSEGDHLYAEIIYK